MSPTSNRRSAGMGAVTEAAASLSSSVGGLASRIQTRIERRLGDRIVDLKVNVVDKQVTLAGRCATYYSKQLAQHAALGVLEDEQLENEILVGVLR